MLNVLCEDMVENKMADGSTQEVTSSLGVKKTLPVRSAFVCIDNLVTRVHAVVVYLIRIRE